MWMLLASTPYTLNILKMTKVWMSLGSRESLLFESDIPIIAHAFEIMTQFNLHLPSEIDRDARSKMAIVNSSPEKSKSKDGTLFFTRRRTIYQCQCGTDHEDGRLASKKRQMGWENVGCGAWFRLTSTHDEHDVDENST